MHASVSSEWLWRKSFNSRRGTFTLGGVHSQKCARLALTPSSWLRVKARRLAYLRIRADDFGEKLQDAFHHGAHILLGAVKHAEDQRGACLRKCMLRSNMECMLRSNMECMLRSYMECGQVHVCCYTVYTRRSWSYATSATNKRITNISLYLQIEQVHAKTGHGFLKS
jgi:hypothetical protein